MILKTQLQQLLKKRQMTAAALSRQSGVSKQVISHWLNAGEPRRISQVKAVAEVLGVSVDELCFGETKKSDQPFDLVSKDWMGGFFEVRFRRVEK